MSILQLANSFLWKQLLCFDPRTADIPVPSLSCLSPLRENHSERFVFSNASSESIVRKTFLSLVETRLLCILSSSWIKGTGASEQLVLHQLSIKAGPRCGSTELPLRPLTTFDLSQSLVSKFEPSSTPVDSALLTPPADRFHPNQPKQLSSPTSAKMTFQTYSAPVNNIDGRPYGCTVMKTGSDSAPVNNIDGRPYGCTVMKTGTDSAPVNNIDGHPYGCTIM
ncbi:hypothetical protein P152DRAFT_245916 [Eremomyces bilateralis CBS 781.70]|uniref:Uncharacterized protein n=1 Tax=Eremomyces bilateralis CBS 781.70 TaxID=1392243 RepID=A0A6G1GAL4_9PEZI|nr:uncharacterized protein P152DRAFT_245916 [Eremomyces bilateralis CBS 781.70]KAF1815105.1 hypothetical protein P152DRAFT_245916 [Eremomyces bilateralis CBS 781.70]